MEACLFDTMFHALENSGEFKQAVLHLHQQRKDGLVLNSSPHLVHWVDALTSPCCRILDSHLARQS